MEEKIYLFTTGEMVEMADHFENILKKLAEGLENFTVDVDIASPIIQEVKQCGFVLANKFPPGQREKIVEYLKEEL